MNLSWLELKVPPVLVVAVSALSMWAIAWTLPALGLALPSRMPVAIVAILIGVLISVAGAVEFRRARTTFNPMKPDAASALVVPCPSRCCFFSWAT